MRYEINEWPTAIFVRTEMGKVIIWEDGTVTSCPFDALLPEGEKDGKLEDIFGFLDPYVKDTDEFRKRILGLRSEGEDDTDK